MSNYGTDFFRKYIDIVNEARQLTDPDNEVMVVKNNEVIVIDKKDLQRYKDNGWELAESTQHSGSLLIDK
jgi:hypothetical protein